jgi:hypothetical protein
MTDECKVPCDICGGAPAYWWAGTSAATCGSLKCNAVHTERYEAGRKAEDELRKFQKENGYD